MTELREFLRAQQSDDPIELTQLSRHHDPSIRSYVAENPNTNLNVLKRMLGDTQQQVCIYLLRNPKITHEMCITLTRHTNDMVKREACILAIRRYKRGECQLTQKDLFDYIKIVDPKANNLDAIEALVEINEMNDGGTRA